MKETRLNKFLSEAGVCSRRKADELIAEGRIFVDGEPARMGQRIRQGQEVLCGNKIIYNQEPEVLLALYKPRGIICTTSPKDRNNIVRYMDYPVRIYPIGRLDKESEGLILLTNQGELGNEIMRARNMHEKEYIVKVDRPITEQFLEKMAAGVPILNTVTRPCIVKKQDTRVFSIILTQGLNRQIRRMCDYLGYQVRGLKRIRIMNIRLDGLKYGEYREVTKSEIEELKRQLWTE